MTQTGVRYRFAFDIGGTFTDLVLAGSDGTLLTGKVLTRHDDFVAPIMSGLRRILADHGIAPDRIGGVVAGATTAVTNLIIERKGAPVGLIATEGFKDVIEIGRELRYDIYDLTASFPAPIVPRALRAELAERIDSDGIVLRAPTDSEIESLVTTLRQAGAKAIAVSLLHSYRNPVHEEQVLAVVRRVAPELFVSLSSDILAELREYERTVATALNAYVMPMIGNYLGRIEDGLRTLGIDATLRVMQSNGGTISREFAERAPIRLLESGPAAGALGAVDAARKAECGSMLAFDMGGTTAKACLVTNQEPDITVDFETARIHRFKRGSGFPVRLPTVDLIEIGAGGGSIAYLEITGLLKVGPRSAGSNPGPACYGLGGSEPTVTDAALVLGYLEAGRRLSGEVVLSLDLAQAAIKSRVADQLGMTVLEAANGIHRIVCEQMAAAAKIHAVDKGRDLRRCALFAFGGAGPIHAREVARRTGCAEIIVPANAGVFSAEGLLVAPLKVDLVRTRYGRLDVIDWAEIETLFGEMEARLASDLIAAGATAGAIRYRRSADMRYVGQGFEVTTGLPTPPPALSATIVSDHFTAAYTRQFDQHLDGQAIEILNWRLQATAQTEWPAPLSARKPQARRREKRARPVFFPGADGFIRTPVLDQSELADSDWVNGPALIEQDGSTVVVGPTDCFRMDGLGNIRIAVDRLRGETNGRDR